MNRIYRSIWNEALSAWVAVSEITKARGNRSPNRRKLLATGLLICTSSALALPTGEQLIAGQANVSIANAEQMQIQQNSQQTIINWQGFSIVPNEAVNIQQPNANAALLNRVVGQDASQIQGQLNANGQVYLVNPNGVAFSKTAQVDVGALVASTHNISNADFMAGKNHFTQEDTKSTVENHGTINTKNGGVVALIGESVINTGTINTPKGTSVLVAGKTVDLDFQGNGLVEVKVSEAALNAQISNKGVIQADGGRVVLSAKAAGQLIDTVINQEGIVQAQSLVERNDEIILDGGEHGAVKISGTLDAGSSNFGLNTSATGCNIKVTGQQIAIQNGAKLIASGNTGGGTITIGDKQTTQQTTIEQDASVSAQTLDSGKAGTIKIVANMDNGLVKVDGLLDASAPKNGDGGFIDSSAAHVKVSDSAKISTKANNGKTGKWLIDPTDYTIAASGGDITGVNLANYLLTSNVELQTLATGSTGQGDIFVNDAVTWNNLNTLTLTAHRNININAAINAAGGGNVSLRADSLATGTGTILFANNGHITANNGAAVTLYYNPVSYADTATQSGRLGNPYSSKVTLNTGSTMMSYMLVNDVNQLQAMNTNLTGNYALGKDIDASATIGWNEGAGFLPVGAMSSSTDYFFGNFNGLGHTITGLTINRPTTIYLGNLPTSIYVGLFGATNGSNIRDIGMIGIEITGGNSVGGLVGDNYGNIDNSYIMGNVNGAFIVGGLVGYNSGNINNSYAMGSVNGGPSDNSDGTIVGGLVGCNHGSINNSYAMGSVNADPSGIYGATSVGGLVGDSNDNISNSYYNIDQVLVNGGHHVTRGGLYNSQYQDWMAVRH